MRAPRRARAIIPIALVAGVVALLALALGPAGEPERAGLPSADLPAPARPGIPIPALRELGRERGLARWAPVRVPVSARTAPGGGAVVGTVAPRTPEETDNLVLVRGRARSVGGRLWVPVLLPSKGARATGWVPRRALGGYEVVRTHLRVDRARRVLVLERAGRTLFRAPVGVGTPANPTPAGSFYVRSRLDRYSSPAYGPLAFGTSAQSPNLSDWPDGGWVGIHGTDRPDLLPGAVSHGCIRLRNADILRLARLMPVGTPLTVT